jgi:pimeloyl-ACP methyl ester carboxylesterase
MVRCLALLLVLLSAPNLLAAEDDDMGKSGFVDSDGVKIHYRVAGKGPLVVLLHGFPDYHYSWRHQVPALSKHFRTVAIDLRGYNLSGQPKKDSDYAMPKLVADVAAVIAHFKEKKAIVIGHDWGGAIAWSFAMSKPDLVEKLVILNCPHPAGISRELKNNPAQQKASAYARAFQEKDSHTKVSVDALVFWVKDAKDRKKYREALKRSSLSGMLAYYRVNYPKPPYKAAPALPKVKCPVLILHGLADPYLLPGALNDTWQWLDGELTLVTIPKAGHWVHHDAKERVNKELLRWLKAEGSQKAEGSRQ